jgi:predicted dehydrogenase/threonine dehydrogenase-like Zn-dependent dehydrogenase
MRQIQQSLKTGKVEVTDVPVPAVRPGQLLIRTSYSLVSAGTERMLVEFGRAGWIQKARSQPDKVRQVVEKIRTDGLLSTVDAVRHKLDQPLSPGYCNVGVVQEVGSGVKGFEPGQRIVSNGPHAEFVCVAKNLCARVPDMVSDEHAAFTVLGAIALQGIRLAQPTLGEALVVAGLGLVGQLTVQLLRAHGCRVLGLDYDRSRLELAQRFGAEVVDLGVGSDPIAKASVFSRGRGVDGVIVTASTKTSEPVHQAAQMCRKRGRIVLVGVTGMELSRADFYEKELTFQVSCSYGPGRYDPNYEERGQDYPIGFVRWTERRNFEAVLDMMEDGRVDVEPLITHRFPIEEGKRAYDLITSPEPSLGILLSYSAVKQAGESRRVVMLPRASAASGKAVVSFIGAGNYATGVLIPAFKAAGARLRMVAASGGVSGVHAGRRFGFEEATTDPDRVLADQDTAAVVIATRHDSHAHYVVRALQAGKHVFVEKPLCITSEELDEIEETFSAFRTEHRAMPLLMVGFNRRYSPLIQKAKALLNGLSGPKAMVMTVNAGVVPVQHWTQDRRVGGGRIVGEGCHFIDLLRFLVGARFRSWRLSAMDSPTGDTTTLQFEFEDGSIGTVHYWANGTKSFPKERLEVFVGGGVLQLDNFRVLRGFGWPGFKRMSLWRQDKGQRICAAAFVQAMESATMPIPTEELFEVHRVTMDLAGPSREDVHSSPAQHPFPRTD